MKRTFAIVILILAALQITSAQLDRSVLPGPGPAPAVAFPSYELLKTANGMRVIILSDSKLPTISMRLLIDRKPVLEGEFAGVVDLAGSLLRNGTTTRSKDQLDREIDMMGGSLSSSGTSVFASGLSKYTGKLMELMADITLHPSFPQDELDKLKAQSISGLKYRKTDPNQVAEVLRRAVLYGKDHPYGEVETEETIGRITRAKCVETYHSFFKPNHAILAVVGDIQKEPAMALIKKYFGSWKEGKIPAPLYPAPKPIEHTAVALVDRPGAVQTVLRVAETVDLQRTSPEVMPVSVMNTVLGGGIFRLFVNLREKHAYTYGAYSSMGPDELIGAFTASTSVKTGVTDSALTQIFYEIRRIRDELVEPAELQMAKNYLSGSFVRSLETPNRVAGYAIEMERYHLGKDYYRTYLKRLEAVTADDVEQAARTYLKPERMLVAAVGSAADIKMRLSAFGPVTMYDEEGRPVVALSSRTPAPEEIFRRFIEKTGGEKKLAALKDRTMEFSGKMQTMSLTVKTVNQAPDLFYQEMGMMGMVQKSGFDGAKGWTEGPQGVKEMSGEQLEEMKSEAALNFYDTYPALGYKAEVTGKKTINGKECYEVSFTKASAPTFRHYFGVEDSLKHREATSMTTPRGPLEQSTDLLDYKEMNGFLVPTRMEQSVMGQTVVFTLEKFLVNTGVEKSLFQMPMK